MTRHVLEDLGDGNFFTAEQKEAVDKCSIQINSNGGKYSEDLMARVIARVGEPLELVKEGGGESSYERYCVKREHEKEFFDRDIYKAHDPKGGDCSSSPSEETILFNIELIRRTGSSTKIRIFKLVFGPWWNYAMQRLLELDKTLTLENCGQYTTVKIIRSLFSIITKDLKYIVKPGNLQASSYIMGVDWRGNTKTARRVVNHCGPNHFLDKELSVVEVIIEGLGKKQAKAAPAAAPSNLVPLAQTAKSAIDKHCSPYPLTRLHLRGVICYGAPIAKPLPPGFAAASDITAVDSVCRPLPLAFAAANGLEKLNDEQCAVCLEPLVSNNVGIIPVSLKKCGHNFHLHCVREAMAHQCSLKCPECRTVVLLDAKDHLTYLRGNMPSGTMEYFPNSSISCAGHESCGIIEIIYSFRSLKQEAYHPNPGQLHSSSRRTAYLPNNREGLELMYRLQVAFLCGLTFTIGTSLTTNRGGSVTWASIPHKTSPHGGVQTHGFPDDDYLRNCNQALDVAGVPSPEICCRDAFSVYKREWYRRSIRPRESSDLIGRAELLFNLIHAQHCKSTNMAPCAIVSKCHEFKALNQHIQKCSSVLCGFSQCTAAKYVLDHYSRKPHLCGLTGSRDGCEVCGLVRSALKGAKAVDDDIASIQFSQLSVYSNVLNNKRKANFFYRQNVQSVFITTEGGTIPASNLSLNWEAFASFVELSGITCPTVETNSHIFRSDLYRAFVEEGINCSNDDVSYDVGIVFHGTSEVNIESILRDGLDPTLRKGQRYGQGEYFASNPAMSLGFCRGGMKMLVFAVITTETDIRGQNIIVVKKPQRQLPIATLSFDGCDQSAMKVANYFQAQVSKLEEEMKKKEKLAKEARDKEKIVRLVLQGEYLAASDIYNLVRGDGSPPESFAEEVAVYVRDHIRDDEMVDIYFPKLPPRPIKASDVMILNTEKCEAEAEGAKRKYETISKHISKQKP